MSARGTGLGRVLNIVQVADAVFVNLKAGESVTFVGYKSGGDTYTISEAAVAGGSGSATLAKITDVYTSNGVGGAWTKVTQAANAAYVASADCVAFTVNAEQLSDGKTFISCASTSTGTVTAIVHDLSTMRTPANLPSLIV
jgi:hypothetical protein